MKIVEVRRLRGVREAGSPCSIMIGGRAHPGRIGLTVVVRDGYVETNTTCRAQFVMMTDTTIDGKAIDCLQKA